MKITLFISSAVALLLATGCSKNDNNSAASPSPTATASSIATISPTASPAASSSPFANIDTHLRDLNARLDDIFSNTFRDFGTGFGQSGLASSIDLREQKDSYIARVYVPHGDTANVNARVEDGVLHVTTQSGQTNGNASSSARSDEVVSLPQPVNGDQLKIDRKPNMVVITIPKTTASVAAASPAPSASPNESAPPALASNDWDTRMFDEMRRMQAQMDDVFHNGFPNDVLNGTNALRLGSTVNVDDQGDKYVVHFTLPRNNMSNVNVKFENGQLTLTAQDEQSTTNNASPSPGAMANTTSNSYEQMITLPGPVKDAEMKVERKNGGIVVTLPKA